MDSKFKDSPSEKLDVCLKQNFSPSIVDEFFKCLNEIYGVKEWTDLYVRKAEGREFSFKLVYAYSDTLTRQDTKAMADFIFNPPMLKSESD